jgi:NAD(P)-dependent dehydrogenase (short-subunit alcohol dehydrogenase family)
MSDEGHRTLSIVCDVSDDAQVEAMIDKTLLEFGRLDAAYNNAGIQNVLAETAEATREDYDRQSARRSSTQRAAFASTMSAPDSFARQ